MTLPASYTPSSAAADGVTTDFTFNFPAISTTFIKVYSQIVATRELTEITTGFTVTENATKTGGTVAFTTAPLAAVGNIIIERETPQSQPQPLSTSTGFPAKVLEQMFDKVVAMVQERFEELSRAISFQLGTSTSISAKIPAPVAGKTLKGASDGLSFETSTYDPDEQVTLATAQAVIATTQASNASSSASAAFTSEKNAAASALAAAGYAASIDPSTFVKLTTDQTIAGVKTFSSSPIIPAPTTDLQASTKKYVDDNKGEKFVKITETSYGGLTQNNNYHKLDLSSILPVGAKRILFTSQMTDTGVRTSHRIRKNGTSDIDWFRLTTQVSGVQVYQQGQVEVDANRIIEYIYSEATTEHEIHILGYWI